MTTHSNVFGQPIGVTVADWTPRTRPARRQLSGTQCKVEPLDAERHAADLYVANRDDTAHKNWIYLSREPPADFDSYRAWLASVAANEDPLFYAIIDHGSGMAVGLAAYLRIDANNGVVEVGHLNFSPRLQRTRVATEAMFLMMQYVFDELGYRRYEWKCDSLNAPSRAAAQRFGFSYEGIFRQALVYKNRNRDTAWFSIIDSEWPAIKTAFQHWLALDNFDARGQQYQSLSQLMQRRTSQPEE